MKKTIEGLYDATWFQNNDKPCIVLLHREQRQKKIEIVDDFLPYIYTTKELYEKYKQQLQQYLVNVESINTPLVNDSNKKLVKLIVKLPSSIYTIKNLLPETYESDIFFINKYIIDNVDKLLPGDFRANYFDIETTTQYGFPDYMNPIESVISIASYDNYLQRTYLWIWHKKYKCEIVNKDTEHGILEIRRFTNEKEMLESFIDFIQATKPDYILAWNAFFDVNYITARMERVGINIQKLSPLYGHKLSSKLKLVHWLEGAGVYGKRIGFRAEEKSIRILGLQWFDLLMAYKTIVAQEQASWSLDFIAEKELKMKKLKTHFDIGKKWLADPEFIEQYNYLDAILIQQLDKKLQLLKYYNTVKDTVFLININDTMASGRVLDNYMFKKYKDIFIFPSKTYNKNIVKKAVGGAFVKSNSAGIYKNVAVFDFSGFYPSLMRTFNLSTDMLVGEEELSLTADAEENAAVPELLVDSLHEYNPNTQCVTYKIRTAKYNANLTYDLSRPGVMTGIVNDLIELRGKAKQELKKYKYGTLEYEQWYKLQQSYKFIINAAWGVSAYTGYRLFNNNNANAITGFARMINRYVGNKVQEAGWRWVGADTDSNFFCLKTSTLDENLTEVREQIYPIINKTINEIVRKFLPEQYAQQHCLKVDMEKIYSSLILMGVKKRYIGRLKYYDSQPTEKLHYMGLDLKKSNTIKLCKEALMEIAIAALDGKNIEIELRKYYEIIKQSDDIDLFKMSSKLEKPVEEYKALTPTKRAVIWSNTHLNTKFRQGTKFFILWVKKEKTIQTDVVAFEDKEQLIDYSVQIDKEKYYTDLYNKVNNLLGEITTYSKINEILYQEYTKRQEALTKWFN